MTEDLTSHGFLILFLSVHLLSKECLFQLLLWLLGIKRKRKRIELESHHLSGLQSLMMGAGVLMMGDGVVMMGAVVVMMVAVVVVMGADILMMGDGVVIMGRAYVCSL